MQNKIKTTVGSSLHKCQWVKHSHLQYLDSDVGRQMARDFAIADKKEDKWYGEKVWRINGLIKFFALSICWIIEAILVTR
jgi:hypothetical protein